MPLSRTARFATPLHLLSKREPLLLQRDSLLSKTRITTIKTRATTIKTRALVLVDRAGLAWHTFPTPAEMSNPRRNVLRSNTERRELCRGKQPHKKPSQGLRTRHGNYAFYARKKPTYANFFALKTAQLCQKSTARTINNYNYLQTITRSTRFTIPGTFLTAAMKSSMVTLSGASCAGESAPERKPPTASAPPPASSASPALS